MTVTSQQGRRVARAADDGERMEAFEA